MKNFRHYLTASLGLVLFASVIAFSLPQIGHADYYATSGSDKDVMVINTAAQPVPVAVQGTTNIAGGVSVTNTPTVNAKQSGAWTVGISGTPTVEIDNSAGGAIAVRDIDRPTAQPFQYQVEVTLTDGEEGQNVSIPIPSGKLLVIENVSAFGIVPNSQLIDAFEILTHVAPNNILLPHYLQFTKQSLSSQNQYTVSQMTRIYADAPDALARVDRGTPNGTVTFRFTVAGYLVDK